MKVLDRIECKHMLVSINQSINQSINTKHQHSNNYYNNH